MCISAHFDFAARSSYPRHRSTGSRGYFGKLGSVFERSHIENSLPRVLRISFWWRQESHRPAFTTTKACRVRG